MTRGSVHTVGIDLAVQNAGTASCRIEWASAGPKIGTPLLGRSDDQLMEDVKGTDIVGIDAPFGWPEPFFDAIRAHRAHGAWPGRGKGLEQFRQTLRLRCTDLVVKRDALLTPLSVSADKIAVTTFRCALLLDRLEHEKRWLIDRSGLTGRAVEVYPAAALEQWDLTQPKSYKAADAYAERTAIARGLAKALDVTLPPAVKKACRETDHALDALVSAVVARAAALGWTRQPWSDDEHERATVEGWIHFPHPEAALRLVGGERGPNGSEGWPPPRKKSRAKGAR